MEKDLKNKLASRVDTFIKEMEHRNDHMFTYDELMPIYEKKLKEYSKMVYGSGSSDFTKKMFNDLKESIYPDNLGESISPPVKETTDGTDEIITSLMILELGSIVYEYESSRNLNTHSSIDYGRDSIRTAILYFYNKFNKTDDEPVNRFFNVLGKHIYRNS